MKKQQKQIGGWALLLVSAIWMTLMTASAQAEIFRYQDSKGRSIFTDRPVFGTGYTLIWRSSVGKVTGSSSRPKGKKIAKKWKNKKKYSPIIKKAATSNRVSPELLHAVIQAESAYNHRAKSSAGAMGLMQLMPQTAKRFGVSNVWDPRQNVNGGAKYLRLLLDLFKNNLRLALAAYNAGEGAVKKYGNRIPPYPETQNYVRKVIKNYLNERRISKTS